MAEHREEIANANQGLDESEVDVKDMDKEEKRECRTPRLPRGALGVGGAWAKRKREVEGKGQSGASSKKLAAFAAD